jgi:hypothetical protein
MGTARFVAPDELDVDGKRIRARAVVVATGSRPVVPGFLKALGDCVLTTDTLFARERLPRSIGIVGAGAVGLEMAAALSRLGVRVVAADLKEAPGGVVDPVIAERAVDCFHGEFKLWLGQPVQVEAGPPAPRSAAATSPKRWTSSWQPWGGSPMWRPWTWRQPAPVPTPGAGSTPMRRRCGWPALPCSWQAMCILIVR